MATRIQAQPRQMAKETAGAQWQQRTTGRLAGRAELREVAARREASGLKTALRRAFYRAWGRLPRWGQRLAVRLAAPKVTLGACAVIQDARGRVLLAHHTYRARPWGLPGGFVGAGEQPSEALARELSEELGVAAQIGPVLAAETDPTGHQLTVYYRATLLGAPREDGIEIDGFRYAAPDEVAALLGGEDKPWLQAMALVG